MPRELVAPDDPYEWIARAKSDLGIAASRIEGVYLEDLCFHTQQAAEKGLKAVLIKRGARVPRTHDLAEIATCLLKTGLSVTPLLRKAARLTDYAVESRYPGVAERVTENEWREALTIAQEVVLWAEEQLR